MRSATFAFYAVKSSSGISSISALGGLYIYTSLSISKKGCFTSLGFRLLYSFISFGTLIKFPSGVYPALCLFACTVRALRWLALYF